MALGIGVWSLTRTRPAQIGSLGLAPALPPAYYAALAAAVIGPVLSCRRTRQVGWLLAWQLVVLIVLLHGIDPIVHGTPRLEASYRHLGIASYIAGSGQLDPRLDAYFSWPGFFALLAMVSDATGIRSLLGVATWAPLGADLLLLPVLVTLARRLAPGWRTAWAGVWVYFLTDWVGQDYLSPQTFAFQLALTVLAIVLVAFNGGAREREGGRARRLLTRLERAPATRVDLPAGVRVGLLACCAVLLIAITVAHQLTPFALALVLVALAMLGQSRLRFLSALAVLLPVAWLVLVATPYLVGHEATLFGSLGNLSQTTAASVSHRVAGDPGHLVVVHARLVETALVWVAAAAGAFTLRRRRRPWLAAAVCGAAPMLLVPAQPYGGELILRVYLYGLPFAAGLAAVVLVPAGPHRWARTVAAALVGLLLAGTTVITRYGNDSLETFTPGELALTRQLDAMAPPGAVVIEAVHDTPWRFEDYATFRYRTLLPAHAQPDAPTLTCAHVEQLAYRTGAFLLVTQSQLQTARLLGIGPPGAVQAFLATCQARPRWTTIATTAAGTLVYIIPAPPSLRARHARRPQVLPQRGHPSCQFTTVCQPAPAR